MIPADWPRPFALMTALLGGQSDLARDLARGMAGPDWESLTDLAIARHRVAPAILTALDAPGAPVVPEDVEARLAAAARRNGLYVMAQIAETRRIRLALDAAGIELAVFKGWPLSEQLFGDPAARVTGDIDLLVPEDRVTRAVAALEEIGFEIIGQTPHVQRRVHGSDNASLIRVYKDIKMRRAETGILVELHWRMLNYYGWPGFLDLPGAYVRRETEAGPLLVPGDLVNLMYLSTHGAMHLWEQLKWLADIAALARVRGPEGLADDLEAARRIGVGRPVAFALSLAHRLLASPLPAGGVGDAGVTRLEDWILAQLPEGWTRRRRQIEVRWMCLRLADGWRQRFGVFGYDTIRRARLVALDLPELWRRKS